MNTTEDLITTGCPAVAPQLINKVIRPIKFPAQPQEWKIVSLRECPMPENMQRCETPDEAAAYWRAHIPDHPYFNPECECLVVLILNTRRRIKGHYLVPKQANLENRMGGMGFSGGFEAGFFLV
jgi:hypothetical protein